MRQGNLQPKFADLQGALAVPLPQLWSQLDQRQLRPELMDQPGLDPIQHQQALLGLARINGLTRSAACFFPSIRRHAKLNPARRLREPQPLRFHRLTRRHLMVYGKYDHGKYFLKPTQAAFSTAKIPRKIIIIIILNPVHQRHALFPLHFYS
jgi:hypothetical protein